jgi:hypothetical protein
VRLSGPSLGQQDARHYFMLQDALILAANILACSATLVAQRRGGSRNEDRRSEHTSVTGGGQGPSRVAH